MKVRTVVTLGAVTVEVEVRVGATKQEILKKSLEKIDSMSYPWKPVLKYRCIVSEENKTKKGN